MKSVSFKLLIAITAGISGLSCRKPDIAANIPSCIRDEIKDLMNDAQSPVNRVNEYLFQGMLVYGFDHNMVADGTMEIKDGDCNALSHVPV